jgi:hypothetical protein
MERREEYSAYIGPNAGTYLDVFSRFTAAGGGGYGHGFAFSWNWPAFFCGVWWYLYRKMYLWAAVDFGVSVVFGWTFFVPLLWAAARAVTGNYLYFLQAERKIREAAAYPSAYSPAGGDAGGGSGAGALATVAGGGVGGAADPRRLALLERLAREGGVHRWVAWAAVVGAALLFGLAALLFRLFLEMLPAIREQLPAATGTLT